MRLQVDISDDSRKKLASYKASLEQKSGHEISLSVATDSYIQNSKITED